MNSTTTLADLATAHPSASRVFHRFGLDFCCGGRRPLAEACRERGLDEAEVLEALSRETADQSPAIRWDTAPIPDLVAFIVSRYHDRLREELPQLVTLAAKVESKHAEKPSCPHGLADHLASVHQNVLMHLAKEERILFPLILDGMGHMASGPVRVMEQEHDDHREEQVLPGEREQVDSALREGREDAVRGSHAVAGVDVEVLDRAYREVHHPHSRPPRRGAHRWSPVERLRDVREPELQRLRLLLRLQRVELTGKLRRAHDDMGGGDVEPVSLRSELFQPALAVQGDRPGRQGPPDLHAQRQAGRRLQVSRQLTGDRLTGGIGPDDRAPPPQPDQQPAPMAK